MELSTRKRDCSPGFTLVEIMVSMIIALIVMGGVYRTLLDEDVNQERNEMVLEMQNNARVALEHLTRDVRRSGFLGCGGELTANTLTTAGNDATMIGQYTAAANPPGQDWISQKDILSTMVDDAVFVDYLGAALGFLDDAPAGHLRYQEKTDALTLVYLTDEQPLENAMAPGVEDIDLFVDSYAKGDILYVTDCSAFALFQKTNDKNVNNIVEHTGGELLNIIDENLGKSYGAMARVFKLTTDTYFIHTGDYNLCHNAPNRSIASNIEDLQFEFLFDTDLDGNLSEEAWVTNLGANTSKDVRAIRIWVLAMSEPDFGYTDTNKYVYPNSPYAASSPAALAPAGPPDSANRHRFLASAVVVLRNAGLLLE